MAVSLPALAQYTYYYSDTFTALDTTKWNVNTAGCSTPTVAPSASNGLTGAGAVISKIAVPDSSSDYEVKIPTGFVGWSNSNMPTIFLRASADASLCGASGTGTFYAIQLSRWFQNFPITLTVYKRTGGVLTQLLTSNTGTWPGTLGQFGPFSASIRSDGPSPGITIRVGDLTWFVVDSSIASGQPGVGNTSPTGGVVEAKLGPLDRTGPVAVPSPIGAATFPDKVVLTWSATTDAGSGLRRYQVWRDGTMLATTTALNYTDDTVVPASTYSYSIIAEDWHGSLSTATSVTANTTALDLQDPRRVGIVPTGAYWGAAGEQIDMLSGNLNFTMPLLKAIGRGSWSAGFALSYNSQLWQAQGTTNLPPAWTDVGYGFGWRLMAGAIFPHPSGYYIFTDSSGAEHKLGYQENGIWRTLQGLRLAYDPALARLYFNDGSFWQLDCVSGGAEPDAGTRYPTMMQDANGNRVVITYRPASGSSTLNTSARIQDIDDVRSVYNNNAYGTAYRTFSFTYDTSLHLTAITNTIGTGEAYTFEYWTPEAISSPLNSAPPVGTFAKLKAVKLTNAANRAHNFEYAAGVGELTKVIFPYSGEFRYDYGSFTYAGGNTLREVTTRYLVKQAGATPQAYPITRNSGDSSLPLHSAATITDAGGVGQRYWSFSTTNDWRRGLQLTYEQRSLPGPVVKSRDTFTWALSQSGHPYVGTTLNVVDPGTASEKTAKSEQTLDRYGNVLASKAYDYTDLVNPARTTTCQYRHTTSTAYETRYLRNLVTTCTLVTGGQSYTLFTNTYDTANRYDGVTLSGLRLHDTANYPASFLTRGNLTDSTQLGAMANTTTYNMVGAARSAAAGTTSQQVNYNSAYSAPTQITTNGNSSIQTNLAYTSFLGLQSSSQANGTSVSFTYDSLAQPATQSSPDGTITFTYATAAPWWKQSALGGRWSKTWFDGFGRPIKEETGDAGGTKSISETEYDACACTPIGKLKRTSRPYAPGGTVYWTTNTYDALGRTVTVALPSGAGSTTYSYAGNTVTVTDPAGRWKKFTSDAFGNLIQVNEPNPAGGADYVTTYTYNGLGKLTQVSMPRPNGGGSYTQTRTFVYDTQGRMSSETNPETGTTSYTYDSYGRLATRTDAKGQRTETTYDSYQRVSQVRYYNAANTELTCERIDYAYDAWSVTPPGYTGSYVWGRLAEVAWGNQDPAVCGVGRITEQYGYDVNGRQIAKALRLKRQNSIYGSLGEVVVNGNWTWSRGQIATLNFPSQSVLDHNGYGLQSLPDGVNLSFTRSYDTMGRQNGMTTTRIVDEAWQTSTIVDNVTYGPANELTQIRVNGVNETRAYNTLGQLTGISYGGTLRHEYRYSASANDGRAVSYKNWQSGEDVQYTYDSLARLTKAETLGPDWGQSFGYDGWGNLLSKSVTKGSAPVMSVTADAATNRLVVSGMAYDANGNVTNMPGVGTLAYDARNRITGTGGVPTRGYDPGNRKIWWKDSNGITFVDYWLPNGERLVTYKIDESTYYSNQSYTGPVQFSTISRYLHFAGRQVKVEGRYGVGGYVEWPQPDRLSSNARHHPYGEERGTSTTEYKFATYQREASGLDYALNRYYSSVYGRFLSSDPYRASGGPSDPGSWNRYAYVQGDPVNFSDPEGLFRSCPNRDGCRAQHIFDDFIRTDESMGGGGLDVGSGRGFAGRDGAGGGSRPSPRPPSAPKPDCFIELWSRPVPIESSPADHTYLLVKDSDNKQYTIEGGPTLPFFLGFGYLFGKIAEPGGGLGNTDPENGTRNVKHGARYVGDDACDKVSALLVKTSAYNSGGNWAVYDFTGTTFYNSNSFTSTLLDSTGLRGFFGPPSGFLFLYPGWGKTVPGL
jgi:RHS repeat-associated protein